MLSEESYYIKLPGKADIFRTRSSTVPFMLKTCQKLFTPQELTCKLPSLDTKYAKYALSFTLNIRSIKLDFKIVLNVSFIIDNQAEIAKLCNVRNDYLNFSYLSKIFLLNNCSNFISKAIFYIFVVGAFNKKFQSFFIKQLESFYFLRYPNGSVVFKILKGV